MNARGIAYLVAGVALLSALTVFLALCQRDNSLLSAGSPTSHAHLQTAPQAAPIVSADPQPADDSITRVTVPTAMAAVTTPEKRLGKRFVDFTLARSRRFQQVGPVSIGVWRVDSRHKLYDVSLVTNGHRVDRKRVGLNTPVSISSSDFTRPLQLVVNSIQRGGVSGYLTEPQSRPLGQ